MYKEREPARAFFFLSGLVPFQNNSAGQAGRNPVPNGSFPKALNISEAERYDVTHAPLGTGGQVVITEAADILHVEELEDVVHADHQF